ncbi:MAG TPA: lipopolysaccharide kinase InaA family protein [Pseudomonadales bacterium]
MAHHELLDKATFDRWRAQAAILERDAHGDKVLQLSNGLILKLFRDKGFFSRGHWLPLSARFARNARALIARHIPTVRIQCLYRLPWSGHCAVLYEPLPGTMLRDLGNKGELTPPVARQLGEFIARLHQQGVMFRSLHLGNILLGDNGELGLIDIADMRCRPWPLNRWQRARNFAHFFRYADNAWALSPAMAADITQAYFACTPSPASLRAAVTALLQKHQKKAHNG